MKLAPVKIRTTDFDAEDKPMADELGSLLNPFFDQLVLAFNKNLSVEDNLPFEFVTLDVAVNSTGVPLSSRTIKSTLKNFKGYICVSVTELSGSGVYPSALPLVITTVSQETNINITKVLGLPSFINYRLLLMGIS